VLSEYNHWARKRSIQRSIGVVMATALAGAASLIGVVTFATAPASAAPTETLSGPACWRVGGAPQAVPVLALSRCLER